jgi:hypothetical protein
LDRLATRRRLIGRDPIQDTQGLARQFECGRCQILAQMRN